MTWLDSIVCVVKFVGDKVADVIPELTMSIVEVAGKEREFDKRWIENLKWFVSCIYITSMAKNIYAYKWKLLGNALVSKWTQKSKKYCYEKGNLHLNFIL